MGTAPLRQLPSVERLLQRLEADGALSAYPRALVVACTREVVEDARARLLEGRAAEGGAGVEALVAGVQALLTRRAAQSLAPAINATGIVLHTNLGRAPLCAAAREAVAAASGYAHVCRLTECSPNFIGRSYRVPTPASPAAARSCASCSTRRLICVAASNEP